MEFYVLFLLFCSFIIWFQFPTGWNSTRYPSSSRYTPRSVSIPNGMEILRYRSYRYALRNRVSIPNGMEFYLKFSKLGLGCNLFQFPTGWNSTLDDSIKLIICKLVSIPNGMEFYQILNLTCLHICCFNSQRDEILLKPRDIRD